MYKEDEEKGEKKSGGGYKTSSQGKGDMERTNRVKDGFPGGSVKLYWCVSLSLIVSLPWL